MGSTWFEEVGVCQRVALHGRGRPALADSKMWAIP